MGKDGIWNPIAHTCAPSFMQELRGGPTGLCLPACLTSLSSGLAAPFVRKGSRGDIRQLVPVAEWKVGQRDFIFKFVSVLLRDLMRQFAILSWAKFSVQVPQGTEAQMRVQVYLYVMWGSKCFLFSAVVELPFFFVFIFFCHYLIKVVICIFYYHDLYWLILKVNTWLINYRESLKSSQKMPSQNYSEVSFPVTFAHSHSWSNVSNVHFRVFFQGYSNISYCKSY